MSTPHRPDPRFLTHFVDACFCHRTHAAGYGAWAKKAAFEKGLIFGGRFLQQPLKGRNRAMLKFGG